MCKVELKVQEQFIAGILIKNGISEISEEQKEQLLKDSYAKDLIEKNVLLLKEENSIEIQEEKVEVKKAKKKTSSKKREEVIIID